MLFFLLNWEFIFIPDITVKLYNKNSFSDTPVSAVLTARSDSPLNNG